MERLAAEIGDPNRADAIERRIDELEMRRQQVIAEEIAKLKDSFGEDRFQALDAQVRAGKQIPYAPGSVIMK